MSNIEKECLELLRKEVCPALGCTEPVAVALAVARAAEELSGDVLSVNVKTSANIYKNGMGVGVSGTDMVGLDIAAALGAVCGDSSLGLEVIKGVCSESTARAKQMIAQGRVSVTIADTDKMLYVRAVVCSGNEECSATITDRHSNIVEVVKNGELLFESKEELVCPDVIADDNPYPSHLTVAAIYDFASNIEYSNIEWLLESATMNFALAEEGLRKSYGVNVGRVLSKSEYSYIFGDGIMQYAMALSAAASDARMAGAMLPAMSNSGSGNQGITVTLPVVAVAKRLGSSDEQLARALALSHLTAIHIKSYLGRLSALCGCVVASSGASCGIVYLLGGDYDKVTYAIKNMIGNVTGMVCDGAKTGCAMKVSSGVASAVQSATLAMDGICISENDGIIDDDVEQTIKNLALVGSKGMATADKVMLDIMLNKKI